MPLLPESNGTVRPLTLSRWLHLYFPLALTFLLMSGSSPIINMGIGSLPDESEKIGFAAFTIAFVICIFLYSPVFSTRDAALKFVRGRTSCRRILGFHLVVAGFGLALLLILSLTPVLDRLVLDWIMRVPASLVGPVKRSVLSFAPIPILIVIRGVFQSIHITNDTPKWIGVGTAMRFVVLAAFVFCVGVPLKMEGGVMGGLALSLGVLTETVVVVVTARLRADFIRGDHASLPPPTTREIWNFAGPLFAANAMGVFMQPLTIAIVNTAILKETSAAAFGIVKSFTWFFSSTLFAMQAMVLARADSVGNLRRLFVYAMLPVTFFTSLILVFVLFPGARNWLFAELFVIDTEEIAAFAASTLPIALALPLLMAIRAGARGLLMRAGRTGMVSYSTIIALAVLVGLLLVEPSAAKENGAVIGYACWLGVLLLETFFLLWAVTRVGLTACVTERGRRLRRTYAPAS
ncbi:MAG: hypothetical protein ABFS86_12825 [Planctomycetota bacterium]